MVPTPKNAPLRLKGKAMAALREDCYTRDGGLCQACGVQVHDGFPDWHDRKYHMAHIKAKRIGGDYMANVRTLCGRCHRAEHNSGKPVPAKVRVA